MKYKFGVVLDDAIRTEDVDVPDDSMPEEIETAFNEWVSDQIDAWFFPIGDDGTEGKRAE